MQIKQIINVLKLKYIANTITYIYIYKTIFLTHLFYIHLIFKKHAMIEILCSS